MTKRIFMVCEHCSGSIFADRLAGILIDNGKEIYYCQNLLCIIGLVDKLEERNKTAPLLRNFTVK